MRESPLTALLFMFVPFSLTAFGGGLSVISGIQEQTVNQLGWMTAQEFLNYFAISRAAPGPGSLLSSLVGWHVAGLSGALVATLAMFVPSSLLCLAIAVLWRRYKGRRWLSILEMAVAPIGVGLLIAGLLSLAPLALSSSSLVCVGLASFLLTALKPSFHPALILCAGAAANASVHFFIQFQ
ncbi:chromate transporter [Ensifer adhaerens]|jgi:chromate transporter|uniref:chromate transporter n=1 Tax=Ensifer adhaerens TaxID=106592 RepID=UPI00202E8182|nr:chromate transporter [Ensifer adhaerens]